MKARTVLLLISVTATVSGAQAQEVETESSETSVTAVEHPILSTDLTSLRAARPELDSAADQYAELHIFETFEVDDNGTIVEESGATWRETEVVLEHVAVAEPASPELRVEEEVLDLITMRGAEVDLWLSLDRNEWAPNVSVAHAEALALLEGTADTEIELQAVRENALDARHEAGLEVLEPFISWLEALGAEVVDYVDLSGTVRAVVPSESLEEVLEYPGLNSVELHSEPEDDAGFAYSVDGSELDGYELMDLLQVEQFYDSGYFGMGHLIGLTELGGEEVRRDHQGFWYWNCRFENCSSYLGLGLGGCDHNADPDPGAAHATATASILIGDITRQQDYPAYNCIASPEPRVCHERSGVARYAEALGVNNGNHGRVVNVMTDTSYGIKVLNQSSTTDNDPYCEGDKAWSKDWNSLYESGIAVFNSAGNLGHGTSTDCRVKTPATAIGVFTVGGYQVDTSDNEVIFSGSSRGGTASEGGGRTIVDIMGPTHHQYAYPHDSGLTDVNGDPVEYGTDWPDSTPPPQLFGATSGATPSVAGSAVLFREWYLDKKSALINNPGILYANLLLMGDRLDESGSKMDEGFDGLWGAGKLRMRKWGIVGMDAPYKWGTGSVCVDGGSYTYIDIATTAIHSDVDVVKATSWWYDHRHDTGTDHDNVYMDLQYLKGASWVSVKESHTEDNKQRVFREAPASWELRLRLYGADVTSDVEGCGNNSTRVYYAYMYEDQDDPRDFDGDTFYADRIRPDAN